MVRIAVSSVVSLCTLMPATTLLSGCSKRQDPSDGEFTRKGMVKSVDLDKKAATVIIDDKFGNKIEIDGAFTDDTAITIDGTAGRAEEIRPGDTVEITATRELAGAEPVFVARRIVVVRGAATPASASP